MKRLLLIFSMILLASCEPNDLSKDFRDTKAYFTEFNLFNNDYVVLSTEENNYCKNGERTLLSYIFKNFNQFFFNI